MDAFEESDYEVLANTLDFLRFQPNDPLVTKGEMHHGAALLWKVAWVLSERSKWRQCLPVN